MLDEEIREFLGTKPDSGRPDHTIEERRAIIRAGGDALFRRFGSDGGEVGAVEDHLIERDGESIRVRIYRPGAAEAALPIHVFLHGGGWWLSSADELVNDAVCRTRCREIGCLVVAVDYRLAPEHRYPTAVEDCYAGLLWAVDHAARLGGDPENVSIGGISSGANLAAAVALASRDRGGPVLRFQLLEVPPLDLTLDTMRRSGVGDQFGITVDEMRLCVDLYLRTEREAFEELASPLLATDLAGLPATRIMTAEFDPLRLDGERFCARLRAAGVPVWLTNYPGAVHGSLALTGIWKPARTWQKDTVDWLAWAHRTEFDGWQDAPEALQYNMTQQHRS